MAMWRTFAALMAKWYGLERLNAVRKVAGGTLTEDHRLVKVAWPHEVLATLRHQRAVARVSDSVASHRTLRSATSWGTASATRPPTSAYLSNTCTTLLPVVRSSKQGRCDLDKQERSILAYLLSGEPSTERDETQDALSAPERSPGDLDDLLRNMGYSPAQREQLRRGTPRSTDASKYRDTNFKRFKWHLAQLLPDRTAEELATLARAWVAVTDYDLDSAQRWWAGGVDPGKPDELTNAIAAGFQVQDLKEVVGNRTIAEHLQAGNSLRWCMLALGSSRRRPA
jgi:hypothetical protein